MLSTIISIVIIAFAILLVIGVTIYLIVTRQYSKLKAFAYQLMFAAESCMVTKEGKEKMDFVFVEVYKLTPAWLKKYLSIEYIKAVLQYWYNIAKKHMIEEELPNEKMA